MRGAKGLIAVLGLSLSLMAQATSAAHARRILEQHGCQTVLPGEAEAAAADSRKERQRDRSTGSNWARGMLAGGLAQVVLWSGVGLAVIAVVIAVLRARGAEAPPRAVTKPAVRSKGGTAVGENVAPHGAPATDSCDALAAQGDYAAAVHAALLRAFTALASRIGGLPQHATGRELLRLDKVRSLGIESLRQMVSATERVHFGGRAADRALYDQMRLQLAQWEAVCRVQS